MKETCTAIVLAAGRGRRMETKTQKQYLMLKGKQILTYSLEAFQQSPLIDRIILVTGENEIAYCREEIVERYHIKKVEKIVAGGSERYESVWKGLQETSPEGYVFIHDGARPFVNAQMIERVYKGVLEHKACVVGMPVKDTIKIADADGFADATPDRNFLWMIQTPQVFETALIREAYKRLMESEDRSVTDDAMVLERFMGQKVKLIYGSYKNIKITTPEDLDIAEIFVE